MASKDGEEVRIVDKFNGKNFNQWKLKMEMIPLSKDHSNIVKESIVEDR